jgi:hypothetical protein
VRVNARYEGELDKEPTIELASCERTGPRLTRRHAWVASDHDPELPPPSFSLQVNGAVTSGPDLSVEVNGLRLPNPFVIGSGEQGGGSASGSASLQSAV